MKEYRIEVHTMEVPKSKLYRNGYDPDAEGLRYYVRHHFAEEASDPTVLNTASDLASAKKLFAIAKTNVSHPHDMGRFMLIESLCLDEYEIYLDEDGNRDDEEKTDIVMEYTSMDASDDFEGIPCETFNAYVILMDDDIRESVHDDMALCTNAEFLTEYQKRHTEKYGKPLEI